MKRVRPWRSDEAGQFPLSKRRKISTFPKNDTSNVTHWPGLDIRAPNVPHLTTPDNIQNVFDLQRREFPDYHVPIIANFGRNVVYGQMQFTPLFSIIRSSTRMFDQPADPIAVEFIDTYRRFVYGGPSMLSPTRPGIIHSVRSINRILDKVEVDSISEAMRFARFITNITDFNGISASIDPKALYTREYKEGSIVRRCDTAVSGVFGSHDFWGGTELGLDHVPVLGAITEGTKEQPESIAGRKVGFVIHPFVKQKGGNSVVSFRMSPAVLTSPILMFHGRVDINSVKRSVANVFQSRLPAQRAAGPVSTTIPASNIIVVMDTALIFNPLTRIEKNWVGSLLNLMSFKQHPRDNAKVPAAFLNPDEDAVRKVRSAVVLTQPLTLRDVFDSFVLELSSFEINNPFMKEMSRYSFFPVDKNGYVNSSVAMLYMTISEIVDMHGFTAGDYFRETGYFGLAMRSILNYTKRYYSLFSLLRHPRAFTISSVTFSIGSMLRFLMPELSVPPLGARGVVSPTSKILTLSAPNDIYVKWLKKNLDVLVAMHRQTRDKSLDSLRYVWQAFAAIENLDKEGGRRDLIGEVIVCHHKRLYSLELIVLSIRAASQEYDTRSNPIDTSTYDFQMLKLFESAIDNLPTEARKIALALSSTLYTFPSFNRLFVDLCFETVTGSPTKAYAFSFWDNTNLAFVPHRKELDEVLNIMWFRPAESNSAIQEKFENKYGPMQDLLQAIVNLNANGQQFQKADPTSKELEEERVRNLPIEDIYRVFFEADWLVDLVLKFIVFVNTAVVGSIPSVTDYDEHDTFVAARRTLGMICFAEFRLNSFIFPALRTVRALSGYSNSLEYVTRIVDVQDEEIGSRPRDGDTKEVARTTRVTIDSVIAQATPSVITDKMVRDFNMRALKWALNPHIVLINLSTADWKFSSVFDDGTRYARLIQESDTDEESLAGAVVVSTEKEEGDESDAESVKTTITGVGGDSPSWFDDDPPDFGLGVGLGPMVDEDEDEDEALVETDDEDEGVLSEMEQEEDDDEEFGIAELFELKEEKEHKIDVHSVDMCCAWMCVGTALTEPTYTRNPHLGKLMFGDQALGDSLKLPQTSSVLVNLSSQEGWRTGIPVS